MSNGRARSLRPTLVIVLAALAVLGFLAWKVHAEDTEVTQLDHRLAKTFHDYQEEAQGQKIKQAMEWVTYLGSLQTTFAVGLIAVLLLLSARSYWLLFIWLFVLVAGHELNHLIKDRFERPRPEYALEKSWSFPSGHSMDAMIGYGMLIYMTAAYMPNRRWPIAVVAGLAILLVGFSRMYLGAHYLSDVLGGFATGAAWLGFWILGIEVIRQRATDPA